MTFFGVDGCKYGWFFVRSDGSNMDAGISRSLAEIVAAAPDDALILIDIPIGLRDDTAIPRACDSAARKVLRKPRMSTVFAAPIRAVLSEQTHASASAKSQRLTGKGISQQCFAIVPKIREVDELMSRSERARRIVREIHPEVCFWGLNGGSAMVHGKKSKEGFAERMTLLQDVMPAAETFASRVLHEYRRSEVAKDDIADAMAALATAIVGADGIRSLPEVPERDSRGLPMEMVYTLRG